MKIKNVKLTIIILFILVNANNALIQAQVTGGTYVISPAKGYSFQSTATGKLLWKDGKRGDINVNITLRELPSPSSTILIEVVAFLQIGTVNGIDTVVGQTSVNPNIELSNNNRTSLVNHSVLPPDVVDRFYFNVTMLTRTTGNITQGSLTEYSFRFPDNDKIVVERNNIVPLVNLYGFPPSTFFSKWLPIYGLLVFVLIIPGFISILGKIRENKNEVSTKDKEEMS